MSNVDSLSLPEVANGPADMGELMMPRDAVETIVASLLSDDLLFERAKREINDLHFRDDEASLAEVWRNAVNISESNGRQRPSFSLIRRGLDSQLNNQTQDLPYDVGRNILAEARVTVDRLAQRAESIGNTLETASLVRQFLEERDVNLPVVRIVHNMLAGNMMQLNGKRPADYVVSEGGDKAGTVVPRATLDARDTAAVGGGAPA